MRIGPVLILALALNGAHALASPADEALAGACWPRDVPLKVAVPAAPPLSLPDFTRCSWTGGQLVVPRASDPGRPKSITGSLAPDRSSGPGDASAAPSETARLESAERAVQSLIIDLTGAAGDYVAILNGPKRTQLLRPLLLFLVERGVLRADEVGPMLAAENPQPVLMRLRDRLDRLKADKEALLLRRYMR